MEFSWDCPQKLPWSSNVCCGEKPQSIEVVIKTDFSRVCKLIQKQPTEKIWVSGCGGPEETKAETKDTCIIVEI